VAPKDLPVGVDDEDGGGGQAVSQDVVDAVVLADLVVGIGQNRVGEIEQIDDVSLDGREGSDGEGDDLGTGLLESLVVVAQLDQLRSVRSSPTSLEEDEDDGPLLQLTLQGYLAASGAVQREVRRHRGHLGLRRGGRSWGHVGR